MTEEVFNLLTFESTHQAIKAEATLLKKGLYNRIISIPAEISAGCGLALKVNIEDFEKICNVLKQEKEFFACYLIIKKGFEKKIIKL